MSDIQAQPVQSQRVETFTASANQNPGDILEASSGLAGVVMGSVQVDNGDDGKLDTSIREYLINNVNSSFNPSTGDAVGWDSTAGEAVAADSADANFYLGICTDGGQGAGTAFRLLLNHRETVAITDSSGGTADGTVEAVSGSGADAAINNNFAEIVTALKNANIMN